MQASTAPTSTSIEQQLQQAMQQHGAGHLDAALAMYQGVLAARPEHPDALHLSGVLHAQRGRHDDALALISRAIEVSPREAMFHNNLGNVQVERGDFDAAEASYVRALELDAARLDALNNLGVLMSRRGRADDAEKLLLKVIELAPDFADAHQNLASHHMRQGHYTEAVQQCFDGLIVAPRDGALRRLLGMAYSTMGMNDKAVEVYRNWLAAESGNTIARYHLSACTGDAVPERAPDAYVAQVFDSFARSFDAKLGSLSYQAPALGTQAVARHLGPPAAALDVLDAGCGTGLCGPGLTPYARRLVGVDLSIGMLAKARLRACYDELVQGELVAFLQARPQAFDVIVSTDTLNYFGLLDACAAAAAAALRRGGLFVFTLEAHADDDGAAVGHRLHGHGRYSHRRAYVVAVLEDAGFDVTEMQQVVLRMEAGEPVNGWLVSATVGRKT
jgi:predicted TPR repeat methyltransferase